MYRFNCLILIMPSLAYHGKQGDTNDNHSRTVEELKLYFEAFFIFLNKKTLRSMMLLLTFLIFVINK